MALVELLLRAVAALPLRGPALKLARESGERCCGEGWGGGGVGWGWGGQDRERGATSGVGGVGAWGPVPGRGWVGWWECSERWQGVRRVGLMVGGAWL